MENQHLVQEYEVDLSRYIKVIMKRKMTFILVFLLTFASGFARIQFSPKIYKITMVIQLPIIGESLTNKNYPETLENIKFLLSNGAFNAEIVKRLNLKPGAADLNFEVSVPPNTNFIMVSVNQKTENKELGMKILRTLFDILSDRYSVSIQLEGDRVENEIKIILNNIARAEESISSLDDRLKEIKQRDDKLLDEVKSVNANTADLIKRRDILLRDNPKGNEIASLLYSNVIQFNLGYMNQLNNQIADVKNKEIDKQLEIKDYRMMINNSQIEIDKLKMRKQFSSGLKILKEPEVSSLVGLNKTKVLFLTIFLGLILAASVVLLQEFWANNMVKK